MEQTSDTPPAPLDGRVLDATEANWVDGLALPAWRPFLRLSRADRPIGTWLLLLPCWWGIALAALAGGGLDWIALWLVPGCALGAFLMRGAGCTWNDLVDRDLDAQVHRTRSRPLPSGQVSARAALGWAVAQSLAAFLILISFNLQAIALGVASLALVAVYPFAKRFTWWPQVFLGLAFNWGVLLLYAAHGQTPGVAALLLYAAGIAWTLHYDTIYAHQDREDDALIGVRSTARLFGEDTVGWLWVFTAGVAGLGAGAVLLAGGGLLALAGVAGLAGHMASQIQRLDMDDSARCLMLFRETRLGGLFLAGGLWADALSRLVF